MRRQALNQFQARRLSKRAQVIFLIVGAGSVGAAVFGARPSPAPAVEPLVMPTAPVLPATNSGTARPKAIDADAVAARYGNISNPPTASETPGPDVTDSGPDPLGAADGTVHYLGTLQEPGRRLALMKIGERQRLLAVGDSVIQPGQQTGPRLTEIADDYVVIDESSGARKIEKSARQGGAVTFITGNAGASGMPTPPGDAAARIRALSRQGATEPAPNAPQIPPPGARGRALDRRGVPGGSQ